MGAVVAIMSKIARWRVVRIAYADASDVDSGAPEVTVRIIAARALLRLNSETFRLVVVTADPLILGPDNGRNFLGE